jgi:hypothetical protein
VLWGCSYEIYLSAPEASLAHAVAVEYHPSGNQ